MQISEVQKNNIRHICKVFNNLKIDCLYVADSMGSLNLKDSEMISKNFSKYFKGDLGIHAHDNLKLALKNSMVFLKNKFSWVDATIMGMGRGPGNTKTEELVKTLKYKSLSKELIRDFRILKNKYNWGTNEFYKFSGINRIHPTYVQELLSIRGRYSKKKIFEILSSLSKNKSKKYDPSIISKSNNSAITYKNFSNFSNIKKNILGNSAIIFGPNKGLGSNIKKLNLVIEKKNIFTIITNSNFYINPCLVNIVCACHPSRLITDYNFHLKNRNDLVLPSNNDSSIILNKIKKNNLKKRIFKFNLNFHKKNIKILPEGCTLPKPLVLPYAISLAISLGFKKIYLYGFKEYEKENTFYDGSDQILNMLKKNFKKIEIYSTPFDYYSCVGKQIQFL